MRPLIDVKYGKVIGLYTGLVRDLIESSLHGLTVIGHSIDL